jgi:HEPN domain-containing protein
MQEHEKWLAIAEEDLRAAKGLLKLELFSPATYHCHQSAEKALKGYLSFIKHDVIKTHDLMKLVGLCIKHDSKFEKLYDLVEKLNPFATRFRYPTEFDIPDFADTELAIKQAKMILKFVIKKIVEPETGQIKIFD